MRTRGTLLQKFTFACLAVAFASIVLHSEMNRRYHYSIVHAERTAAGGGVSASLVTRSRTRASAEAAEAQRRRELIEGGWRITQTEVSDAEELHESFEAMFADRPTREPYLSYDDAERREVRVYFYGGGAPAAAQEYRRSVAGARDLREVLPLQEK